MERIQALIAKLKEQADQHADAGQMLKTLQLLQNELSSQQNSVQSSAPGGSPVNRTLGTSKVAVVMPASMRVDTQYQKYAPKPAEEEPVVQEVKETILVEKGAVSIVQENGQLDMVFDPMTEIPTLSHQSQ